MILGASGEIIAPSSLTKEKCELCSTGVTEITDMGVSNLDPMRSGSLHTLPWGDNHVQCSDKT